MPKIPVYTDGESVMAVNEAAIADGYQCRDTGKVFLHRGDYVSYLKRQRERNQQKIRLRNHAKVIQEFNNVGSFPEMIRWIEEHQTFFYDHLYRHELHKTSKEEREKFRFTINSLKLSWEDSVSNTHGCPRNGKTNWDGRKKFKDGTPVPRGYPGWYGKINFDLARYPGFFSDTFKELGLHSGTGGSRGKNSFESEFYMFAADWPKLAERATLNLLKGKNPGGFLYYDSRVQMLENS